MSNWQPPQPPGSWSPPPQQPPSWQAPPPAASSGKATAALVLGICGVVLCPLVLSIPALILGYMARGEIDRSGGRLGGRGHAVAGIVLGWVGIAVGLLLIAAFVIALSVSGGEGFDAGPDDQILSLPGRVLACVLPLR